MIDRRNDDPADNNNCGIKHSSVREKGEAIKKEEREEKRGREKNKWPVM